MPQSILRLVAKVLRTKMKALFANGKHENLVKHKKWNINGSMKKFVNSR